MKQFQFQVCLSNILSLLTQERGLKQEQQKQIDDLTASLLTQERGLKHPVGYGPLQSRLSLLTQERGLKHRSNGNHDKSIMSLLTQERGLKLHLQKTLLNLLSRSSHRSVD